MNVNGLDIHVERKPIRHAYLAVYPPDGRVHMSVPLGFSDERVTMYVLQKWGWIERKRELMTSYVRQAEREYVSGEAHYFKGEKYRLRVNRTNAGAYTVEVNGDYIVVNVHQDTTKEHIRETLYRWYREQLTSILAQMIEKWEKIMDVRLRTWEIRRMTSRWGSCSKATRKALFNVELAKKSLDCIEYVVAHELTHLIERNHTDRFRRLMGTYLPSWRELQKKLNEFPI